MRRPHGVAAALLAAALLALRPAAATAEPLRAHAAGSLAGAFREAIAASGLPPGDIAPPVFGPAGLLRQRIEEGAPADLFASADLSQPRRLAAARPGAEVVPFARNRMCLASPPPLGGAGAAELLDRMLDTGIRLAVSTAGVDPGGDYARAVFARAERLRPGARAALENKAIDLLGPGRMAPVAGRSASASVFLDNAADALLYYCSALRAAESEVPGPHVERLPPELEVRPIYALALLGRDPRADRLAVFLLSEPGQALLARHGLLRLVDEGE